MFKKKTKKIYLCECCPTVRLNQPGKCPSCGTDLKEYSQSKIFFIIKWLDSLRDLLKRKEKKQVLFWRRTAVILIIWLIISHLLFVGLFIKARQNSSSPDVLESETTEAQSNFSIEEKYQAIINGLAVLNKKKIKDEEVKSKIEDLSQEIYNLRALNPYLRFKEIKASFIPSGVPEYGLELNVNYDQAAQAVDILARLEQSIGLQNLTGEEKARYIKIGTTQGTACEFCCGLKTSFAREDGQRACGCGHNIAFSGLTMWMVQNSYTDEEILEEIAKWKTLFFPKQTLSAKLIEMEKAGEPGIKELLEEFPDFLPQMVGGC